MEQVAQAKNFDEVDMNEFMRTTDCMSLNMLGQDIGIIEGMVFDTDEKMRTYMDFNAYQSGKVFGGEDLEQINCDFNWGVFMERDIYAMHFIVARPVSFLGLQVDNKMRGAIMMR